MPFWRGRDDTRPRHNRSNGENPTAESRPDGGLSSRIGRAAGGRPRRRKAMHVPSRRDAPQPAGGMLGAGGTCESSSLTECRRPASTRVTGFCACLRPAAALPGGSEQARTKRRMNRRARGCPCPGAGVADKRSHGWRSAVSIERAQGRMPAASVRRWAWAAPSGEATQGGIPQVEDLRPLPIPIAYAIGLPDGRTSGDGTRAALSRRG